MKTIGADGVGVRFKRCDDASERQIQAVGPCPPIAERLFTQKNNFKWSEIDGEKRRRTFGRTLLLDLTSQLEPCISKL